MDDLPPVTIGCGAVIGVDAVPITLEATLRAADAERPRILGRDDSLVREALTRILSAFRRQGVPGPRGVAALAFAPAAVPKRGSGFDLPMALALAGAGGTVPRERLGGIAAHGEVSLRGRVLPVRGIVAVALAARSAGWTALICSPEDAPLVAIVPGMTAFGVETIAEAVAFLRGTHRLEPESRPDLPPPLAVPSRRSCPRSIAVRRRAPGSPRLSRAGSRRPVVVSGAAIAATPALPSSTGSSRTPSWSGQ